MSGGGGSTTTYQTQTVVQETVQETDVLVSPVTNVLLDLETNVDLDLSTLTAALESIAKDELAYLIGVNEASMQYAEAQEARDVLEAERDVLEAERDEYYFDLFSGFVGFVPVLVLCFVYWAIGGGHAKA